MIVRDQMIEELASLSVVQQNEGMELQAAGEEMPSCGLSIQIQQAAVALAMKSASQQGDECGFICFLSPRVVNTKE